MNKTSIFEYKNYKQYILDWIDKTPQQGRGMRKLIAEAIGCQTPFITHVLSGDYHFSLEQAEALAKYLTLNESETEFFLLLIQKSRAGTKSLENYFQKQITKKCEEETRLKERLKIKDQMSIEDQMIYYSNYQYAAIHMALLIPELQTVDQLHKYFNIPIQKILSILQFLLEHDLIEKKNYHYKVKKSILHLERDSPFLVSHHTQWRLKAIESIQQRNDANLHYSGVMSISQEDYNWVREKLAKFLEEVVDRVKDSKDETLATISFDLFHF